jgi:DNA-binding beta-propeller fold protein YncE/plastocyanin
MKKRRILLALLGILVGWGGAGMAHATGVTFQTTDNPGSWFECDVTASNSATGAGCVHQALGSDKTTGKSLSVIQLGETITFTSAGQANTLHTAVSLIYPTPVNPTTSTMPFDVDLKPGSRSHPHSSTVTPSDPGLHVFFCDIHPYMFAAVIVVPANHSLTNSNLFPLDFGRTVEIPRVLGLSVVPTASDLALRLVHSFFIITNPYNWQNYALTSGTWNPSYPSVPVTAYFLDNSPATGVNLNGLLQSYFGETGGRTLGAAVPPAAPGVGQVWVDTQFEMMDQKTKPGTATAVDATTFKVVRKVGLPHHGTHSGDGMNNPHNMWTDKDQKVIYQTEWFDHYLTVFNRKTGEFVNRIEAGPAPAHVMTRTNNDQVHVSQNGDNNVRELDSLAHGNGFLKDIPVGPTIDPISGETLSAHPHAHWMSANGQMMVTPNADTENSTLYNFPSHSFKQAKAGNFPIATGMMPDDSKYYVANFLDSNISVITIDKTSGTPTPISSPTPINLLSINLPTDGSYFEKYNTLCGSAAECAPIGGLPIQTPVSPDGKYAIVANTLAAKILVIDTKTDTIVKKLDCDAGCHGVQFGAKKGGGYYAYVSSKFSNRMLVVDLDGTATGSGAILCVTGTPCIAGSVLLTTGNPSTNFNMDGTIDPKSLYAGMGGQGVLPIPLVYNGWVQNLPEEWKEKLTTQQKHPFPTH